MLVTKKGTPFINAADITWETVGEGVQRKMLGYDDQLMMVSVRFEKGAIGSPHHHKHRQVTYIESGTFEVTIDGNTAILRQGDSFFVAPDLLHSVVALEEGVLLDIFTPCREDFLL
jgi:quercetin dioxygenase-like cupin family protein